MNRSSGLRIALRPAGKGSQLNQVAAGIPASLVMLLGMALTLWGWFPSAGLPWWQIALGMAALSAVFWLLRLTGQGRVILTASLVLVIAGCCVFWQPVTGGLACLGNDLLDILTRVTGRIYLDFAAAEGASPLWGLIPLAAICVITLQLSAQTGRVLFLLPLLLAVYGAVLLGVFPVDAGVVLLGIGAVLMLMQGSTAKWDTGSWWGAPTWLLVPAVCLLASAAMGPALGNLPDVTGQWKQALHEAVYDRETNSMPEGDLKNLPAWNKNDTYALKITMSQPQKMYLRGRVYETYDGTAWTPLSSEERAEYESLFYWLHESGFYGQSQIGTATAFTTQAAPAEMTVTNLSACTAHGYAPYALAGSGELDPERIGDDAFPESQKLYYYPGSVPQWYQVQQLLSSDQGRGNIAQYLIGEEAYEDYVTEADLQLTNESWSVLNRQLGQEDAPQTLSQIRNFIRTWLEENLVYDETAKTLNGGSDFLQYTLERSGSGYSVHYATAAVLMLRYFGVPARYVEGYYICAQEAEFCQPNQPIILTEKHAHAWAEYYLPGVGFVPFEVTPGYVDDEELELGGILSENEHTYSGDHLKYAQVEQPERLEEPRQNRFSFSLKPVYLAYLLAVALAILAAVIYIKRKNFREALLAIDNAPNRDAIAMRFGYAACLLGTCQLPRMDTAARAEALNREALFSDHGMTVQQRREMDTYAQQVLDACKEKWTVPEKLRYKLWDCLY